ncbi:hypothetical protein CI109_106835 [Kwoniella shandongensis]|uniref:Uncharacterized protein n=1 Tax=Kwoniella shandongensis TaxID=1734106 RepID=A0A5M6CCA0_9TREE|nr:uncharacterized protein CI109_000909 [Kwoniella shandongensis]KAA5530729.1 hypothetical protein CI109_000909 [Kwoniella shandongensis]
MTTLVDIPSAAAFHLPTPASDPLPLSAGDLVLTLIPANPPTHPSQTLTLTIGSSSFPLLPNSPVQKVEAKDEHPSYVFSPVSADGGASIGQVKIRMKHSTNQGEWEATEALCRKFEDALKAQKVWDDRTLFVDDEYETGGASKIARGWGESIAGAVIGASQSLAERLTAYTEKHVATTHPEHPAPPSANVASTAHSLNETTSSLATSTESGATKIGNVIHEGGKKLGSYLPDSIAKSAEPVPEADKSDFRKLAEGGWEQVTIAAKGIASAATTVGGAVSVSAHKAVEHNFGKEAENVAQDIGQAGANVGATGVSAVKATSVIVQGTNATTGAMASKEQV